jgi:predicted glycosyltransferase involved in capsule biosynthesis
MNNTTICIFFRKDNGKRVQNLFTIIDYYAQAYNEIVDIIIYYEYTTIADDEVLKDLTSKKNCKVILSHGNPNGWNKSIGYNQCALLARTPILCFNDVDVIVDIQQIITAENYLLENTGSGLIYPYDGRFLCVDAELKEKFIQTLKSGGCIPALSQLQSFEPATNQINAKTQHVFVGHNNSPGGIVMAKKDNFIKFGGYNPNFLGWGYEDSEILSRARALSFTCGRIMSGPCWHLDHTDNKSSKKETQLFHEQNRLECAKVEAMSLEQLNQYIKTWKL